MWRLYYVALRVMSPAARAAFYFTNKITSVRRPRVAIVHPDGRMLLVRNSLGDRKWALPGGGANPGESDEAAACREVYEELRIQLSTEELVYCGTVRARGYEVPLFVAQLDGERCGSVAPNRFEIQATMWASVDAVPQGAQRIVYEAARYLSGGVSVGRIEK